MLGLPSVEKYCKMQSRLEFFHQINTLVTFLNSKNVDLTENVNFPVKIPIDRVFTMCTVKNKKSSLIKKFFRQFNSLL